MAGPTRVFLLDDHEIVRRGLRELLEGEEGFAVVGEAATAEEALARIPATSPEVAVLDEPIALAARSSSPDLYIAERGGTVRIVKVTPP